MDRLKTLAMQGFGLLEPYPYLQALLVILLFGALAKIADVLISSVCARLAANTKSNVDDQLVKILHRPIFTSVAMVGLVIATCNASSSCARNTRCTLSSSPGLILTLNGIRAGIRTG